MATPTNTARVTDTETATLTTEELFWSETELVPSVEVVACTIAGI